MILTISLFIRPLPSAPNGLKRREPLSRHYSKDFRNNSPDTTISGELYLKVQSFTKFKSSSPISKTISSLTISLASIICLNAISDIPWPFEILFIQIGHKSIRPFSKTVSVVLFVPTISDTFCADNFFFP